MATVVLEIGGQRNENLRFRPLQRNVRGRFDWGRMANPEAHRLAAQYGGLPIPGQRIAFDDEKLIAAIVEPLHDPEHAAVAEKIKAKGFKLPPAREEFPAQDKNTWFFWLKQAVACGMARVVSGKLPDEIDEAQVRRDFLFAPRKPGTNDRLTDALNRMADAQVAQTEVLTKLLTVLAKK